MIFYSCYNLGTKTNEFGKEEIELPDVEPSAFIALLRFLYADDVFIGPDNVMNTLYTGSSNCTFLINGRYFFSRK